MWRWRCGKLIAAIIRTFFVVVVVFFVRMVISYSNESNEFIWFLQSPRITAVCFCVADENPIKHFKWRSHDVYMPCANNNNNNRRATRARKSKMKCEKEIRGRCDMQATCGRLVRRWKMPPRLTEWNGWIQLIITVKNCTKVLLSVSFQKVSKVSFLCVTQIVLSPKCWLYPMQ